MVLCSVRSRLVRSLLTRTYATRNSRVRIADLLQTAPTEEAGVPVSISGWIRNIKKQKRVAFAHLQDGSSLDAAQIILSPEHAAPLATGAAVVIHGRWLPSKGGAQQAFELHADSVVPQGDNDATTNPIQVKYQTADYLRTLPHLRTRTPYNSLLLRLRSQIIADTTNFFHSRNFVQTHPPIVTSSDCEGAGEVFTIEANQAHQVGKSRPGPIKDGIGPFFGKPKYLTVSSQLHLEALAQSVGDVWTLSPTFRAEKSDTARHLSEFYMLEAELAFTDDLNDIMNTLESLIRRLAEDISVSSIGKDLCAARNTVATQDVPEDSQLVDAATLTLRWESLLKTDWPRLTFHEACKQLKNVSANGKVQFDVQPNETTGLQTEHERYLADVMFKGPVFVTDYPQAVKPFYMAPSSPDVLSRNPVPTVSCFDLLLPEVCEVAGGSMREHRLESLERQMREQGLLNADSHSSSGQTAVPSSLDWYLDLRRYGSAPHGGFGLGFDRLLGFLAGVKNVRDVVTFPRYYKHCLT